MRSASFRAALFISAFFVMLPGLDVIAQSRTNQSGTGGIHQVRGKIYLPSGKSLETPVEVELQATFTSLKVFTDRGGSFIFENLAPGSYTVIVSAGDQYETSREYFTIDPEVPAPRGGVALMQPSPKVITVPVYLQMKRGVVLRNEVINAKWSTIPKATLEHFKRGVELVQDKKTAEAEAELQKAIELSPKFAPAHTELGRLQLAAGRLDEAVASCKSAIRNDDSDFDAHLNLGIAYLNQKKYNEAEPELVTAAYLNRAAVTPHYYLGVVFVMRNDLDVAQKAFETAKELGGKSLPAIHRFLGRIYLKKDMEKEGLQELETYIKLAPKAGDVEKVKKEISDIKAKHVKNAFV
ncbi:MAG TPA: tetratricopeptide repeat protein [Pyrinomonadaceae bacterium]|nr:tetratricopeptide repeat protein [Pyrinomonadaceae bacterium]